MNNTKLISTEMNPSIRAAVLANPTYTPYLLLDRVMVALGAKNDAGLARAMRLLPPQISKLRNCKYPLTANLMVRIADLTGMTIAEIRKLAGLPFTTDEA